MKLEELRAALDALDSELIRLLARRASVVEEIWSWKAQHQVARIDPERELELRSRLLAQAEALGLSTEAISAILDRIVGVPLREALP